MRKPSAYLTAAALLTASTGTLAPFPLAQAQAPTALRVIVNSYQDGAIAPDDNLTLREAILIVNGVLSVEQLSLTEQSQVIPISGEVSRIEFNLPAGQTTIELIGLLPDLIRDGIVIDGTTQPGYGRDPVINELPTPKPVVAITPRPGIEVKRGLTVTANNVTIRGLSLYGFTGNLSDPTRGDFFDLRGWETRNLNPRGLHRATATVPPADIFISHKQPPPDITKQQPPANFAAYYPDDLPAQNVVIEDNWLGFPPVLAENVQPATPETRSAFGVSVFNGMGTTIRRNWIANHDGSGIITAVKAEQLLVTENVITGNGVAGMPDAIRLEGKINQAKIAGNLICGNDGSGVYLFKPEGSVAIENNLLTHNSRRLRRAAIYLMGSQHQVTGNQIRHQTGPGVVVTATPRSVGNRIQNNQFSALEGLSIDLVQLHQTQVYDYQRGDGPNPPRDSHNRRKDTANAGVNAPRFVSREFYALGTQVGAAADTALLAGAEQATAVEVFGTADPGTEVELYRTVGDDTSGYAPLAESLGTALTDAEGKFKRVVTGLRLGDRISATATHPDNGTSEPAPTAVIRSLGAQPEQATLIPASIPRCVTAYVPPAPPVTEPEPTVEVPVRVQVPTRIHFALDQSLISPSTARVLDRVAEVMLKNPALVVDIEGHTDPRASDAYNLELGQRRALSARNYLIRKGIAPERMTIRSLGKRQRLTQGASRLDYARDRRVELIFRDARGLELIVQEEDLQIER